MNCLKKLCACLAVLLGAVGCNAKEPSPCGRFQKPVSSAAVLDAIGNGNFAVLVDCGLPPNGPIPVDGQPVTPLQFAASLGKPDVVAQVVRAGADPNFGGMDEPKLPPLEIALSRGKYDAAKTLIKFRARADYSLADTGTTALMTMSFDRTRPEAVRDMAKHLVASGSQVNAVDAKGNTPLHWAARSANSSYVAVLLDLQANACLKNTKGEQPSAVAGGAELSALLEQACKQR